MCWPRWSAAAAETAGTPSASSLSPANFGTSMSGRVAVWMAGEFACEVEGACKCTMMCHPSPDSASSPLKYCDDALDLSLLPLTSTRQPERIHNSSCCHMPAEDQGLGLGASLQETGGCLATKGGCLAPCRCPSCSKGPPAANSTIGTCCRRPAVKPPHALRLSANGAHTLVGRSVAAPLSTRLRRRPRA